MRSVAAFCTFLLLVALSGCEKSEPSLYTINKKRAFFYDNAGADNALLQADENSVFPICAMESSAPVLCSSFPGSKYYLRENEAALVSALLPKTPWKVTVIDAAANSLRILFEAPTATALGEKLHPLAWTEQRGNELLIHLTPVLPGIRFQRTDENEKQLRSIRWQRFGDFETVIALETGAHLGYKLHWKDPLELTITFRRENSSKPKILLDAGHGLRESGACRESLCEKDITLRAAKLLSEKLRTAGNEVLLTRETDELLSLEARVEKAEQADVDLFLSLHTDSWPPGGRLGKPPVGLSCYYQQPFVEPLARSLCANDTAFPLRHTPWITRRSLYVLHNTQFPSLLLELGNLQDRRDAAMFGDEKEFAGMIETLGSRIAALLDQK